MALESSSSPGIAGERVSLSDRERGKLPRWLFLSLAFHGVFIASLFVMPLLPSRKEYTPPVYTVDLVGGEKIGGNRFGTELEPKPAPKLSAKEEAPPPAPSKKEEAKKEAKKEPIEKPQKAEKVKPVEKAVTLPDKNAVKEAKKEPAKKETAEASRGKTEESLDSVRERILQSALERAKTRSESAPAKGTAAAKTADVLSTGPGQGDGAAALGVGGRGGGVVKGMDFIIYKNRMEDTIKRNWVWPGQRSNVKLRVTVRFSIKDSGEITAVKIVQSSGDAAYDDSVLRAVRKSSPLPPVPEGLAKDFSDLEYTFRPEDLGA